MLGAPRMLCSAWPACDSLGLPYPSETASGKSAPRWDSRSGRIRASPPAASSDLPFIPPCLSTGGVVEQRPRSLVGVQHVLRGHLHLCSHSALLAYAPGSDCSFRAPATGYRALRSSPATRTAFPGSPPRCPATPRRAFGPCAVR